MSASIPAIHNLLPFWLAKKTVALAKFTWALYSQWRHSTTPTNSAKNDDASEIKDERSSNHHRPSEGSAAKMGERKTGRGVNGGTGVEKRKEEGESDEGSSSKDKDGAAGRDGGDAAGKVRRRRGMYVYMYMYMYMQVLA